MRGMMESFAGRSIGRLASRLSGLNAIYLPPEASPTVGGAIVREANLRRPVKPHFAILVGDASVVPERNLPIVSRAESIRYRQGDRLAVVPATSVDLASFDGAFREVLGSGFPATALPSFDVDSMASELIQLIAEGAEIDPREVPLDDLADMTARCLRASADILVAEQEGSAGWNAKWFAAVDTGATALMEAVRRGAENGQVATFDEAVEMYVWACFGLPRPTYGHAWKKNRKASDFVQSVQDVWSAKESIDLYTRETVLSGGAEAATLEQCSREGWGGLDDKVVGTGSGLLGLQSFVTQDEGHLRAFSDVTEECFLRSVPPNRDLQVVSSAGLPMAVSGGQPSVVLLGSTATDEGRLETERFTVIAPLNATLSESKVPESSRVALNASGGAKVVPTGAPRISDRGIHFDVLLQLPAPKTFSLKKVGLSLEVGAADPLFGYLRSGTTTVHVLPSVTEALVTIQWNSGKRTVLRQPRFEGQSYEGDPETVFGVELKPDKHHRVVVLSQEEFPTASGVTLDPIEGRTGWFTGDLLPNAGASLTIGALEWNITSGGSSEAPQSLLVAAIDNALVDPEDPESAVMDSLRGQLETLFARRADDPAFVDCLGHIALPADIATGVNVNDGTHRGLVMSKETAAFWDQKVALDAGNSQDSGAAQAQEAFLDVWRECISRTLRTETSLSSQWPSKRSVRHLGADGLIDRMLDRYADLMEACVGLGDMAQFRAAFPFSASVWGQVGDDVECTAVLLSPWHPIRLAWLANVEGVLWNADRARDLAGIVEGWRFPMTGPGPAEIDRMIAVPIDAGKDQIFVGWSMVVRLATGKARHLRAPSQAAGYPMPGSAPSGLTGTAADAAMRDFIRANPHLPSVTIDLASSARGPRLAEIDTSVIRAVRDWSKGDQPILGVRVLDQLTREGDLPRDLLSGLLRDDLKTSVSWSRYAGGDGASTAAPRSNLRLLQDSGVQVGHIQKAGRAGGVLAAGTIRRFETASTPEGATSASMEPGLPPRDDAFTRAVRGIEGADVPPRIRMATAVSALLNDSSDWTISGESFLSPTALAHMIANHAGGATDRMLWEWRPPFLRPSRDQSPLSRRPYVTIARVAGSLVERVTSQVTGIVGSGASSDVESLVDDIFRTLGTRGIGLSSLLSMGGQHASGALGFYLALRLMSEMPLGPGVVQVVLPLDSCQTFIDALAPDSGVTETRRRADLLIIRVSGDQVVLSPIEIKFYGSGGEGGSLPSPGHEFIEPLEQLEATVKLLRKLQVERARLRTTLGDDDAVLWDSALATLFEAGLRLSSYASLEADNVRDALEGLARGDLKVGLGRPLILFFKHQVGAPETAVSYREGSLDPIDVMSAYGALAVRPQPALKELTEGGGETSDVLDQWSALVEWSMANVVGEQSGPIGGSGEAEVDGEGWTGTSDLYAEEEPELGARFESSVDEVSLRSSGEGLSPRGALDPADAWPAATMPEVGPDDAEALEGGGGAADAGQQATFGIPQGVVVEADPADPADPAGAVKDAAEAEPNHGVRFAIGEFQASLSGRSAEYWPGNAETTQLNMGIVGDLGTGKTQLLKALMLNLRRSSESVQKRPVDGLVFDYKRDFQDEEFVASVGATVWQPSRIPLNVLDLHEPYSRAAAYRRAAAFTTMLARIYKGVGPVQRDRLIDVIMNLYEVRGGGAPTLSEVLEAYREESSGDSVTSILNTFVLGEIFTENRDEVVSLEDAMRDTVLVIDLNSLGADSYTKNAIVVFFLDMFYERMKRMIKVPPRRAEDGVTVRNIASYLLVDEASNIMKYKFDVLDSLLKEGREFGVGTILSSQYLSHFRVPGANYAETLSTWFIHKVPNATHTELSALGIKDASFEMAERIRGLKVHESLYRSDLSPTKFIREVPFWRLIDGGNDRP